MASLLEVIQAFLVARGDLSSRTLDWYEGQIELFLAWLEGEGHTGSGWCTAAVIEQFLKAEADRGLSRATVAGRYRALRGFFGWLVQRGYLASSPMVGVTPRRAGVHIPRRAEAAEYERLISSIDGGSWLDLRDRLAIHLMFLGGLRVSEVAGSRASDWDLGDSLLLVRGKGDKDRLVPLLPVVCRSFVEYLYARPAWRDDSLMLSSDVQGCVRGVLLPNGLRLMLRRRCEDAGVRYLNPHSFRHGLAVYLLNNGGDMSLVQRILGHSSIQTTALHYAEWVTEGLTKEFGNRMGRVGGGASDK